MKYAIAIAKAKVKEKLPRPWNRQREDKGNLDREIAATVLGTLMIIGVLIGTGGLFVLFSVAISKGGFSPLAKIFVAAITG